jgi:hypothetical protein
MMASLKDLEWALIQHNGMDNQLLDTDLDHAISSEVVSDAC